MADTMYTSILDQQAADLIDRFAPLYSEAILKFSSIEEIAPKIGLKYGCLLALAANLSCTQLDFHNSRHLMKLALGAGVTKEEIIETAQILCCTGIHATTMAVRVLIEKLDPSGKLRQSENDLDQRKIELRKAFARERGYWNQNWEAMLWLDADYFETYTRISSFPWTFGTLPNAIKELIVIVADTLPSHQHERGTAVHVDMALQIGLTKQEIIEAACIASTVGANSVALTFMHLAEEMR